MLLSVFLLFIAWGGGGGEGAGNSHFGRILVMSQ